MQAKIKTLKAVVTLMFTGSSIVFSQAQQIRNVREFSGIKVGDSFNVQISQSDASSVKVDAPDNVQSQITTEVKDRILTISSQGNIKTDKPITISVGTKSLTSLDVSGSADVKTTNQLICDKLYIESSGAGDVHLELKANEIKTKISGAGDVTLKGTVQLLDADVSGAGDLKSSNLEADNAKIKVSGAGDAKINVKQNLDADVTGAGSIIYKGNPAERSVNITGAGSVRESKSGNGEETASDTTKFKLGKKKYTIIGDRDNEKESKKYSAKDSLRYYYKDYKHYQGFEIGINGIMDYKNSIDLPAESKFLDLDYSKSIQFGINLLEKDFHLYKNYINLVTGFGFDFNHYALKNNGTLNADTSYLSATKDNVDYKKNKLNVSYIKTPLLLEINTSKNPKKNFHIAAGVEFAYRIFSVSKQRFDIGNKHFKNKNRDDFNLEPFRYSAVARIGYNNITIFADYGLNRLFKKQEGPQVYPFTLGITFNI